MAELEAANDDNEPPVDTLISGDPSSAVAERRKRDGSDADMELIAQEDVELGLEEMPRQPTPEEPERKKPRLWGL